MQSNSSIQSAFVFPGQGSQGVGMHSDFIRNEEIVSNTYREASEKLGYDLTEIVLNGPEETLNRTEITQPALLTAGVANWRLWCSRQGFMPDYMAGHSLGEYTALVCAESIRFEDAVTLVRDRGEYMQAAVPAGKGAMAAIIGLEKDKLEAICVSVDMASPANFNSPEQTVIAGESPAVNQVMELALEQGAKRAIMLPVSVPSHCSLMQPAAEKLALRLKEIKISDARIPVVQNVDAVARREADAIKTALVEQLHQPVLWVDTILRLYESGCQTVIESGPGKILSGLIRRINRDIHVLNLNSLESFNAVVNHGKQ